MRHTLRKWLKWGSALNKGVKNKSFVIIFGGHLIVMLNAYYTGLGHGKSLIYGITFINIILFLHK